MGRSSRDTPNAPSPWGLLRDWAEVPAPLPYLLLFRAEATADVNVLSSPSAGPGLHLCPTWQITGRELQAGALGRGAEPWARRQAIGFTGTQELSWKVKRSGGTDPEESILNAFKLFDPNGTSTVNKNEELLEEMEVPTLDYNDQIEQEVYEDCTELPFLWK
ncbi:hypothetical protein Y1Q_0003619 [Alligator mississippiensis]|uniref:EF-hand domain-containing protein n=1 Tax=Alligator mississippiensis TaxID=8496 RepID=A0A151NXW7_ALLMI|nr:hypothetical protein Y1Q_0003619 [Alligator mississippiensis]